MTSKFDNTSKSVDLQGFLEDQLRQIRANLDDQEIPKEWSGTWLQARLLRARLFSKGGKQLFNYEQKDLAKTFRIGQSTFSTHWAAYDKKKRQAERFYEIVRKVPDPMAAYSHMQKLGAGREKRKLQNYKRGLVSFPSRKMRWYKRDNKTPENIDRLNKFVEILSTGKIRILTLAAEAAGWTSKEIYRWQPDYLVNDPRVRPYASDSAFGTVINPDAKAAQGRRREAKHLAIGKWEWWEDIDFWTESRADNPKHGRPWKWGLVWVETSDGVWFRAIDPADGEKLSQIPGLYLKGFNVDEIGTILHLGNISRFLHDPDYALVLADWKAANERKIETTIGQKRGLGRANSFERKALTALLELDNGAGTTMTALVELPKKNPNRISQRALKTLQRLRAKGWTSRDPGHFGKWHLLHPEEAKAFIESGQKEIPSFEEWKARSKPKS